MLKLTNYIFTLVVAFNISTLKAEEKTEFFEVTAFPKSLVLQASKTYLVTFSDLSAQYLAQENVEKCLSIAIQSKTAVFIKHHKKTLLISECRPK